MGCSFPSAPASDGGTHQVTGPRVPARGDKVPSALAAVQQTDRSQAAAAAAAAAAARGAAGARLTPRGPGSTGSPRA